MIYFLLPTLLILLCFAYAINKKDIGAPAVIFSASFSFSSIWALVYSKVWNLSLNLNTYLVIVFGVFDFIIITYLSNIFLNKIISNRYNNSKCVSYNKIVENWKVILFIGIEIFSVLYTIKYLKQVTGNIFLSSAISQYRDSLILKGTVIRFSMILSFVRMIVNGSGYWFAYVISYDLIVNKKFNKFVLIALILSVINTMILGGRNEGINIILCLVIDYYILYKKYNKWEIKIKFKYFIIAIISGFICLLLFRKLGNMLGRKSQTNLFYYIAVYCGSQIKNLDTFLNNIYNYKSNHIWGAQSFVNLISWIMPKINSNFSSYQLDLPYQRVNGLNLGNVYTTFYPYIYDFGYIGVFTMTTLMAIISQFSYIYANKVGYKNKPCISVIIYSYIFSNLLFSFFSNKFYEQLFTPYFLKLIVLWYVLNFIFYGVKIKLKKK